MIPLDEARASVLAHVEPTTPIELPLTAAADLVLAEPVHAAGDVPPFAGSAVDGLAVRSGDVAGADPSSGVRLALVGRVMAGDAPAVTVGPGQAVRIMTGAVMPEGADAVVMVEDTHDDGGSPDRVLVTRQVAAGDHVRGPGEDVAAGQQVADAGDLLGAARLGVVASAGAARLLVHPRPRVGVLATGAELISDGSPLAPGQIRDSNRPALLARLAELGCEAVDLGVCRDDEAAFADALADGARRCDAVVTSGGVSMGEADVVRAVLEREDVGGWAQVAIKPAKPFAWAVVDGGDGRRVPVLGLPGNPVSVLVSLELLARPVLRRLAGHPQDRVVPPAVAAVAAVDLDRRPDGKVHYVRVAVEEGPDGRRVRPSGGQGSHQLAAMADADALAVLPDGPGVPAGSAIEVLVL